MEKLSPEQRAGLTTFISHVRELLRICSHGGVTIEADEFIQQNLLTSVPGGLLAVSRLFQEPDDLTPSGYSGQVRFPGSIVWECNGLVRELIRPWERYRMGKASASDAAFLSEQEEKDRATAFKKLGEYIGVLEGVLKCEDKPGHGNPEAMDNGWQQSHRELYYGLKIAKDKAGQRFPDRLEDVETVFAVADALRGSLIELDGIATQKAEFGGCSIQQVDGLHTVLWNNRELFDSLSDYNRALFTWRDDSVTWRGQQASNVVELIRDESLQYGWILQQCSLHNTLAPSKQLREVYPESWFDVSGVTDAASRIRARFSPAISPAENSVSTTESTFGDYFAHIARYEAAKSHVQRCSSKVTGPAIKGSVSALYVIEASRWQHDANKEWNTAKALAHGGKVQALCEAEFGGLSVEGLRRLRGRLATVRRCGTEDIDSLPIREFAELCHELNIAPGAPTEAVKFAADVTTPAATGEQQQDASGVQMGRQNEAVVELIRPIEQRITALERNRKSEKPPTKTEVLRNQRIQFCCPRRCKEIPDPWSAIWAEYHQKYPDDKTASPDTLLKSHDRNCEKCLEGQK